MLFLLNEEGILFSYLRKALLVVEVHKLFLNVSPWQVKDIMKDIMSNLQQTNSEKILLSWVRQCTRSYQEVNVLNFTTSWSDGLALNGILHHFR